MQHLSPANILSLDPLRADTTGTQPPRDQPRPPNRVNAPMLDYSRALLMADTPAALADALWQALGGVLALDGLRLQTGLASATPLDRGRLSQAQAMHRLIYQDRPLGRLTLYRATPLAGTELSLVEDHLALLLAALHNQARLQGALAAARLDRLTGLPNRTAYDEALAIEAASARRHGTELSLVIIDIDHFKQVNDRHGHLAGDQVLTRMAQVLRQQLRADDQLFRYGGEEFVALLRHTGSGGAQRWAERARLAVHQVQTPDHHPLSASLGVAGCQDGDCTQGLFERADRALYRAKSAGRDQVCVASD